MSKVDIYFLCLILSIFGYVSYRVYNRVQTTDKRGQVSYDCERRCMPYVSAKDEKRCVCDLTRAVPPQGK